VMGDTDAQNRIKFWDNQPIYNTKKLIEWYKDALIKEAKGRNGNG